MTSFFKTLKCLLLVLKQMKQLCNADKKKHLVKHDTAG